MELWKEWWLEHRYILNAAAELLKRNDIVPSLVDSNEDKDVNAIITEIINIVSKKFNAKLRDN